MAHPSALETLIELAGKDSDESAKRLGHAIRAAEETEKKLALLQGYHEEYAARFQNNMATGLTAIDYRNFQLFLEKLESAVNGQRQIVAEAKKLVELARTAWQQCERKRMSYDTLATRANKAEQLKESKRDQKLTDEHATRSFHYKQR